ncbi:hypothetical protein R2A130_1605 [Ahrensia sp. R2A130]|nr:hypothetical protein R2A130_1605 [Ahrensia sp. R2A130]
MMCLGRGEVALVTDMKLPAAISVPAILKIFHFFRSMK